MPAPSPCRARASRDPLFFGAAALLALLCLWPIWGQRFLVMQDYPQHLFISYVLHTYGDPAFDWSAYRVDLRVTPYSLEYWLMHLLARFVSIETAGKLLVSLYVALMGALAVRGARRLPPAHTPWALLLLFPLVFNQTYFLGFLNFLLSLPLLFLALFDLEDLAAEKIRARSALRHAALLAVLLLCHPVGALIYLGFASAEAAFVWRDRARRRRILWPIGLFAMVVATWVLTQEGAPTSEFQSAWAVLWWPFRLVWRFYLLQFTGMRIHGGVDAISVVLWSGLLLALCASALRAPPGAPLRRSHLAWFAMALAGYCALPFWFAHYSFVNLRLAPVSLLALVLWCAPLRVPRAAGLGIAALCAGLLVSSAGLQARVSVETEQILPIVARMERNARVLPVYADAGTRVFDPVFFVKLHAHDHNYYHVIAGGGANPNLFPHPMLPVQFAAKPPLPAVADRDDAPFVWERYRPHYRYVLVRGAYPPLHAYLAARTALRTRHGEWTLYENPEPSPRR